MWSLASSVIGIIHDVVGRVLTNSRLGSELYLRMHGYDPKEIGERIGRVARRAIADAKKPPSLQRLEAAPFQPCNSNIGRDTSVRAYRPELYVDQNGELGCSKEAALSMLEMEADGVLRLDEQERELLMNKATGLKWRDHPDGVHEVLVDPDAYEKAPAHLKHHVGGLMRPKPDWKKK